MANTILGKKGFQRKPEGWECSICGEKFRTRRLLFAHKKETVCGEKAIKLGHERLGQSISKLWKEGKLKGHACSEITKQKLSEIATKQSYWQHRSKCPIIYVTKKGEKLNLDSYWELYVAERLDSLNVEWYRPNVCLPYITNTGTTRHYCPDFFVKDYGCFLEVKSPYISKRQNINGKIDYIKSHYDFIQWIESEDDCKNFVLQKKNYSEIPEKLVENYNNKIRAKGRTKKVVSKPRASKKKTNKENIAKPRKSGYQRYTPSKAVLELKELRWSQLQNCNIDFTKYGWVKEVSKLFGISENKAGKYIKKNFPDFYKNCYVRK